MDEKPILITSFLLERMIYYGESNLLGDKIKNEGECQLWTEQVYSLVFVNQLTQGINLQVQK